MEKEKLHNQLVKYIPKESVKTVVDWIVRYKIQVKITKPRVSKLGDYKPPFRGNGHRISINGDLNPYSFLITLTHEVAHLVTWEEFNNRVRAHGHQWSENYHQLISIFIESNIFPHDIQEALKRHFVNPAASSCRDEVLMRALKAYDSNNQSVYIEELQLGDLFKIHNGRVFSKGEKIRKRYKCKEVETQKIYLFSPVAEVYEL